MTDESYYFPNWPKKSRRRVRYTAGTGLDYQYSQRRKMHMGEIFVDCLLNFDDIFFDHF